MTAKDIIDLRLHNQQIAETKFKKPQEIVNWMCAMQAQEYGMSRWAIGLRLPGTNDTMIEKAFNEGKILRTHLMRPTWHFVSPQDIRWLLKLTAPRVMAANAYMGRKLELDAAYLNRCNKVLERALQGGKHLMRSELKTILNKAGIDAEGMRLAYIMMQAELDAVICSGPRKGKQFTYALLEERVPPVKAISKEESLAIFAHKYFSSRGPVTVKDFAYWSGLTMKDAKEGSEMLGKQFMKEKLDGEEFIFTPAKLNATDKTQRTFLMPDYDEYGMSYKSRSIIRSELAPTTDIIFNRMFIIDGLIEGTWKRTIKNKKVSVEAVPFMKLSTTKQKALNKAIEKYISFAGKTLNE